jgi:hypothetical protein
MTPPPDAIVDRATWGSTAMSGTNCNPSLDETDD